MMVRDVFMVMALVGACGSLLAVEHVPPEYDARIFHVSPSDVDALSRAVGYVRQLKAENGGMLPRGGVIVEFEDGVYRQERPLLLTPEDSGTPECPILYRAQHAGKAVWSGAVRLDWMSLSAASALPASATLIPEAVRDRVVTAVLPNGWEIPSFFCASCYMQDEQLERPEYQHPLALYGASGRLPNARWPNEGWGQVSELQPPVLTNWIYQSSKTPVFCAKATDGSLPNVSVWAKEPDLYLHGTWKMDYVDSAAKPMMIDPVAGRITLDPRFEGQFGVARGAPFFAFNVVSELDRPGEWALDVRARRIYLLPDGKDRPLLARSHGLLRCCGVTDVAFEGFVFEHVRGHALVLKDCRDCELRQSIVRRTTGWGVRVEGGKDCRIAGCDLYDLGEGGVWLEGGNLDTITRSGHVCDNCHIRDYGVLVWNYNPGVSLLGCGNVATHNLIHHAPHQACFFYGVANRFAWNVVHDVCRRSNDCGAIYSYNTHSAWSHRGNEILHNVFHCTQLEPGDVRLTHREVEAHQRNGIYLDAFTSGSVVRGNIIVDTSIGIFSSGGQDNLIERNMIVGATYQPIRRWNLGLCGGETPFHHVIWGKTNDSDRVSYVMKPLIDKRELYEMPFWRARFPNMLCPLSFDNAALGHSSHYCRIVDNVCAGPVREIVLVDEKVTKDTTTVRGNVSFADDPGFVDFEGLDLELRPDSPARKTLGGGTRFAEMGLYASGERISPPVKFGSNVSRPKPLAK